MDDWHGPASMGCHGRGGAARAIAGGDRMNSGPYTYDGYIKYAGEVAINYDRDREVEAHWWKEDAFIEQFFADKSAVALLDVPVGTGRFFRHYRHVDAVVGVDVSEAMLCQARHKLSLLPAGVVGTLE